MSKVNVKTNGRLIENCEYVNPDEWFNKTWLIEVGAGFFSLFYVVEADHESDAIDELTDSEFGHIIKTDELCKYCEVNDIDHCECTYAGNYGDRVNLDHVSIRRCEVVK